MILSVLEKAAMRFVGTVPSTAYKRIGLRIIASNAPMTFVKPQTMPAVFVNGTGIVDTVAPIVETIGVTHLSIG